MALADWTHPEDVLSDMNLFQEVFAGRLDRYQVEKRYYRKDGQLLWGRFTATSIKDAAGQPQFVIGMLEDITERKFADAQIRAGEERLKAALHEKEVLLKEVHHRVKNNLQIVASLLSLQSDQLKDPDDLVLFEDTQNRVKSMALIHESLYRTGDLARFNFAHYIDSLCTDLLQSYAGGTSHIRLHTELDELTFDVDTAVPCGLILNELLTNALKYAFPDGRPGDIHIALRADAGQVTLSMRDTGVGFPADLDFRHTESLGLQLVSMLTQQLGGTITLTRECGTAFVVTFPYELRPVLGEASFAPIRSLDADRHLTASELSPAEEK
jgi:two-component sensor histidine kinase